MMKQSPAQSVEVNEETPSTMRNNEQLGRTKFWWIAGLFCFSAMISVTSIASAQFDSLLDKGTSSEDEPVVKVTLTPVENTDGKEAVLTVDLTILGDRTTYSTNRKFSGATRFGIHKISGLNLIGPDFTADHSPHVVFDPIFKKTVEKYKGHVAWSRKFQVDPTLPQDKVGLVFEFRFQVCNDKNCIPHKRYYEVTLAEIRELESIKAATLQGVAPPKTPDTDAKPSDPPPTDDQPPADDPFFHGLQYQDEEAGGDLLWYLFSAFIGGMILNVMPCVLPVLAIKLLSFVQQAGESRLRIFLLNLSYTGGVMMVFLILATLAVTVNLGWGGLFQSSEFNLIMACLVFAMGLSLLGVFEIPVPGFVGSAAGTHQQEGLLGAFLTGIFATLLATPCSGPFLGATLGWSVGQPAAITFLIWGTMGLGMAFPYLLFGIFPFAIRWLPKPGMWMVRFKEFSGFVLMGTVIFLMNSLQEEYTLPLLVMLLGISLGLWMIGNLYDITSHIRHKLTVRLTALALTFGICSYGYSMTLHTGGELPWENFTEAKLKESIQSGKTVLVDFTADWCLTCKTVEHFALNTPETIDFVAEHQVVTLMADYTEESPEIKAWLDRFDSKSVPLTVVFPAGDYKRPILIRDVYTQSKLLSKLDQAVKGVGESNGEKQTSVSEPTASRE